MEGREVGNDDDGKRERVEDDHKEKNNENRYFLRRRSVNTG